MYIEESEYYLWGIPNCCNCGRRFPKRCLTEIEMIEARAIAEHKALHPGTTIDYAEGIRTGNIGICCDRCFSEYAAHRTKLN